MDPKIWRDGHDWIVASDRADLRRLLRLYGYDDDDVAILEPDYQPMPSSELLTVYFVGDGGSGVFCDAPSTSARTITQTADEWARQAVEKGERFEDRLICTHYI